MTMVTGLVAAALLSGAAPAEILVPVDKKAAAVDFNENHIDVAVVIGEAKDSALFGAGWQWNIGAVRLFAGKSFAWPLVGSLDADHVGLQLVGQAGPWLTTQDGAPIGPLTGTALGLQGAAALQLTTRAGWFRATLGPQVDADLLLWGKAEQRIGVSGVGALGIDVGVASLWLRGLAGYGFSQSRGALGTEGTATLVIPF